jgi:hypothetical protein
MAICKKYQLWWIFAVLFAFCGCVQHVKIPAEKTYNVYKVQSTKDDLAAHFAPVFLTYDYQNNYNRIGRPSGRYDENGKEHIYVDVSDPAIYYQVQHFSTDKDEYTNYIYRVHFPFVPFSLIPFHLSAGKNVGLIIIVTVDTENRPVLVTAVHTCGCYLAIIPTTHLSVDAFPENWKEEPVKVYGERLPWRLEYTEQENPRILVHLRPGVHRVMNLEIIEEHDLSNRRDFQKIISPLVQMNELEKIPIDGKTTSFYYKEGLLKGHVKGSIKFWESILLSPISLDMFVGADKVYADTRVTGNSFYTSLKPWNRNSSDMWNFSRFLKFWGWRL